MVGMRVRISSTRKNEKNSPAIILSVLIVGQCDYSAGDAGGRIAAAWANTQRIQFFFQRGGSEVDTSSPRCQLDRRPPWWYGTVNRKRWVNPPVSGAGGLNEEGAAKGTDWAKGHRKEGCKYEQRR